jgi:hypothetical protein
MDLLNRIRRFFSENEHPFLFTGAGVSAYAGLPVWSEYLKELAELARAHDTLTRQIMVERIAECDLTNAATYYFICNKIPLAEKHKNLTLPLKNYDANKIKSLTDLPFRSYVTTNYDKSLHDAYALSTGKSCIEVNLNDPTLKGAPYESSTYIARIHGRVEVPDTMILSDEHYKALESNEPYTDFLAHIFTRCQIMFVGFSFSDPAISSVLDNLRKKVGTVHNGKHIALIPNNADPKLRSNLSEFNIEVLTYSPENGHQELWDILHAAANTNNQPNTLATEQNEKPFSLAKKYISACYARAKIGRKIGPLREAVVEGLVSQQLKLATKEKGHILFDTLVTCVAEELKINNSMAVSLVDRACSSLEGEGLCTKTNKTTYKWVDNENEDAYEISTNILVSGAASRLVVREGVSDTPEVRSCLKSLIDNLIMARGWDLGAAFASNTVPDSIDVDKHISHTNKCTSKHNSLYKNAISRAIRDLITNPNSHESEALTSLGRASFALELILQSPHDSLFHGLVLPERIYLDANVLMPAITKGHPYHHVYTTTIENLVEAASRARIDIKILVLKDFLNEVISHKRLAEQEAEHLDNETLDNLKKEAMLVGSTNLNVFLGAFINWSINSKENTSFKIFLREFAPYNTESQLASWLRGKGISVIGEREAIGQSKAMPDLLHLLERGYAQDDKFQRKDAILIRHDAIQLSALDNDIQNDKRSVFVSADRRLRNMVSTSKHSALGTSMISHVGLTQLIDLLVGNPTDNAGLSRMMWLGKVTDASEQVRNYFVNTALNEYEAAYAMEMNDILDSIIDDVLLEAENQHVKIPPTSSDQKRTLGKILGTFEDRFFATMKEIIEAKQDD